jgi:hypothetical protein
MLGSGPSSVTEEGAGTAAVFSRPGGVDLRLLPQLYRIAHELVHAAVSRNRGVSGLAQGQVEIQDRPGVTSAAGRLVTEV